ncbi:NlpC/P60 family protein [Ramlibacter sp. AN1015]|uniref:NlpC/P60 family protein n=1 Tax=Ramlibacter sp. AN1015 TaxID=3133428 RepID=UPI0030BF1D10
MILAPEALDAFKRHALQDYPREAAGVLVGAGYVPCLNVAENPDRDFAISGEELARIELEHGRVKAVLHSHPYHPKQAPEHPAEWPSQMDMQCWLRGAVPWGIAATDGEGITPLLWLDESAPEPLVGREFVWGVNDCYSLVRDWFKQQRGVVLPNFAREWRHWDKGVSMYDELFAGAGFVEITAEQVQPGDCVLMRLHGSISSHAAVVTGPDEILHHLFHRLSGYDRLSKWRRAITKWVRYEGDK